MKSIFVIILFALLSFVLDRIKAKNNDEVKETLENKKRVESKKPFRQEIKREKKSKRKIVDREEEIYSNTKIIDKDKLVNDIIFSEILSKPKSKR